MLEIGLVPLICNDKRGEVADCFVMVERAHNPAYWLVEIRAVWDLCDPHVYLHDVHLREVLEMWQVSQIPCLVILIEIRGQRLFLFFQEPWLSSWALWHSRRSIIVIF